MNEDAAKEKSRNDTFSEDMGEERNRQVMDLVFAHLLYGKIPILGSETLMSMYIPCNLN